MERKSQNGRFSGWVSLMYATSALLVICGIPATIALSFIFMHAHDPSARLDSSQAILFGGGMIGVEVIIAVILHFIAVRIERRDKIGIKHETDA